MSIEKENTNKPLKWSVYSFPESDPEGRVTYELEFLGLGKRGGLGDFVNRFFGRPIYSEVARIRPVGPKTNLTPDV